jgi:putative ABC transport system permease protein
MNSWVWQQIWRDLRSGTLRWLLLAVALAVAALAAVGLFADRIERGLHRDAAQLLGGDVIVLGDQPVPEALARQAASLGLRTARTATFPSMARAKDEQGGETRLVAVKAVDGPYPLRGKLTLGRWTSGGVVEPTGAAAAGGPARGTVWVDAGVLQSLGLKVGDPLLLGDASFRIAAVIAAEPDRGGGFVSFSPRVMLPWADLPATGLIQPASRVNWRLQVASAARLGDAAFDATSDGRADKARVVSGAAGEATLLRFTAQAREEAAKTRGVRVETLDDGRPEMRSTIDRAGLFLRLVALLAALMAAVVVAMVSRDFAMRRLDDCALLRVLGVSQRDMMKAYALELLVMGLLASLLGLALGGAFHEVFVWLLSDLVQVELPAPGWWPALLALGVGLALTLGFGLPPLLQLAQVPALRVLRRDLGTPKAASVGVMAGGVLAMVTLLALVVRDPLMASIALGGVLAAVIVLSLLAGLVLWALRRWLDRPSASTLPVVWRQAIRALVAQPASTITQVSALSLGLLAVFLLILIRTDLIASWRNATPPDAPNRFVINVQPDQAEAFRKALEQGGVERFDWFPMVRARLVGVNGKPVRPDDYTEDRARRLVDREFNLSYAEEAPRHNEVVAGRYRSTATGAGEMSMEEGIAKTLGLKLGDRLLFDVGGQQSESRITSLRKVDWGSMRVNFFMMAPVADMPEWPATFISAFRVAPGSSLDRTLVNQFPNVTVVDVTMSVGQVQRVLDQVIRAVEFLFLFTLTAGVLVLLAGLWSSRERRAGDWAVMRALGASREHLARVQRLELASQGLLAGGMASLAALAIGGALAFKVFDFPWAPPWWGPLGGAAVGALLVMLAGWWSLRGLLNRPVLATLRRAD